MGIFSFKKIIAPTEARQEITAFQTWTVRWRSQNGKYDSDGHPECEVFTSIEDATKFANQLKDAFKLLRITDKTSYTDTPIDSVEVQANNGT
jgi:hypothetical protein